DSMAVSSGREKPSTGIESRGAREVNQIAGTAPGECASSVIGSSAPVPDSAPAPGSEDSTRGYKRVTPDGVAGGGSPEPFMGGPPVAPGGAESSERNPGWGAQPGGGGFSFTSRRSGGDPSSTYCPSHVAVRRSSWLRGEPVFMTADLQPLLDLIAHHWGY